MALYKYADDVGTSTSDAFDKIHDVGEGAPWSGIYRCGSCAAEIGIDAGRTLPPTHAGAAQGHKITWRLVVYAHHLT
jgi:hypothetical protein